MYTTELIHFGVRGMRWGVRRDRGHIDRLNGTTKTASRNVVKDIRRERSKKTLNAVQSKMLSKINTKHGKKVANRVLDIYGAKRYNKGAFVSSVVQAKSERIVAGLLTVSGGIVAATLIANKLAK